jgi:hypothetical protein
VTAQWLQLFVDRFMFGPEYTAGCPSCSRRIKPDRAGAGMERLWSHAGATGGPVVDGAADRGVCDNRFDRVVESVESYAAYP